MQWLNGVYGALVNQLEQHRGHVFGSRYGSSPVATDADLLEVLRYIALNPVRAALCDDPADWPWRLEAFVCDAPAHIVCSGHAWGLTPDIGRAAVA